MLFLGGGRGLRLGALEILSEVVEGVLATLLRPRCRLLGVLESVVPTLLGPRCSALGVLESIFPVLLCPGGSVLHVLDGPVALVELVADEAAAKNHTSAPNGGHRMLVDPDA